jgi:hypothetical protein
MKHKKAVSLREVRKPQHFGSEKTGGGKNKQLLLIVLRSWGSQQESQV